MLSRASSIKEKQLQLENVLSATDLERPVLRVADGDAALAILGDKTVRREITPEDNKRILRKIDWRLMPSHSSRVLSAATRQKQVRVTLFSSHHLPYLNCLGLVGSQYSWLSSIVYIAQLIWQPASSYFLVKLPIAKYLFVNVLLWGAVARTFLKQRLGSTDASIRLHVQQQPTISKAYSQAGFFLGLFEATVARVTISFKFSGGVRREQTMRLSMWMAMNGGTGMVGSLLSWGLGHIGGKLHAYQTIFLFIGLLTVVCSPVILYVAAIVTICCPFLMHENQTCSSGFANESPPTNQGTETKIWKWGQVLEVFLDLKTYLWFSLLFLCAVPSGGIGAFGPLIILIVTLLAAEISTRLKLKWPVIFALTLPPIAGSSALFTLGRGVELRNTLLGCYYVLSFFTGLQPMLYTWSSQNTAGHTKKLCNTGIIFVAQCAGNIVGPLLYTTDQKPYYHRGLIAKWVLPTWISSLAECVVIALFVGYCFLFLLCTLTAAYLSFLNRGQAAARRQLGKLGKVTDKSLQKTTDDCDVFEDNEGQAKNDHSFDDLTDRQNEDFIYVL
ncbi:MFS general substrate transporter [Armillaria novae-zelandiae]|uniref:MFS general substrate transporter n=1 Tax=Armillaria novae-zelandiae TaxID=153914 RepID=A0AA39NW37_9AGAR|nr:MFS general substrate transporter [Armillaria novae-zelandiae]